MIVVLSIILIIYVVLIAQLILGFGKVKTFEKTNSSPKTSFSIIVPFRNEEKNLRKLLRSISDLNYPKELFELIMVDDFSKDQSERVYINWRMENGKIETTLLENLRLSNSPKKDALSRAIPIIKKDWVITTDADCVVNENWLLTLDQFIQQTKAEMVVGAVVYKTKNNWFHHFQQLDLLSLQGTTIGSFGIGKPFMCNGANFAYTKKFFHELGGFGGINQQASGDDVMLLQKAVLKKPEAIHYLKHDDSIVKTKPENDLFKLFMQRVRWASKATSYSSSYAKILAVGVLLMNLSLVIGCGLMIVDRLNWNCFLGVFLVKYLVDYTLLSQANGYLRKGKFLLPLASSIVYPVFSSVVGVYSLFGSFTWKGRTFSK
ncbi:glycosyltransferase family 2 protein [Flavobacterium sp.]|uniref:glycosyltransferase family 2 protein n=1 Tax=Flavobacterium sp. TaxID=239 RepID=UPI002B4B9269|nr:glycosyltransferase [Flavobacterium sp.]HLP63587.1 glycosyltransferase [Flavobacterium sp.]